MRKSTRIRAIPSGALATVLVLAGCAAGDGGGGGGDASAGGGLEDLEPIVLTYSESNVETAAHVQAMQTFMDTVTEKTDGKITFETYYAASLFPVTEALSAIQSGLADITFVSSSNVPDLVPAALWETTVAQDAVDLEFPLSLTQGTPIQMAASVDGPLAEELSAYDAETLVTWGTAPNSALCKPEISSADQVEGKTIRTPGPPFLQEVGALGMINATLPVTDVFEGLQRGVIDCFMNVVSPFITLGIWDEAKYFIPANFGASFGSQLIIKKSVLESLPLEVQQIIFDAKVDLLPDILEATLARNVQWAQEGPDMGVSFVDPTTFNVAIEGAREEYVADAIANPPAAITDPEGFVDDLAGYAASWDDLASGLEIESGSPANQEDWIALYESVENIDWDAYSEVLHEFMAQYRP